MESSTIKGLKVLKSGVKRPTLMKNNFLLHADHHINESCSVKRGSSPCAKSIGPGQPARNAQVDLGQNVLLLVIFLYKKDHTIVTP